MRTCLTIFLALFCLQIQSQEGLTLCDTYGQLQPTVVIGSNPGSITYTSNLGVNSYSNEIIHIEGVLIENTGYFHFSNCTIKMGTASEIQTMLAGQQQIVISNCKIFACQYMWKGITIYPNQDELIMSNTHISDAQFAVWNLEGSGLYLSDNTFDRNYIGVNVEDQAYSYGYERNTFSQSSFLNQAYPSQIPDPNGISYAGIQIHSSSGYSINALNGISGLNTFEYLKIGIESRSSILNVEDCEFISNEIGLNSIGNGSLTTAGYGITGHTCFKNNSHYDIYSTNCHLNISNHIFEYNTDQLATSSIWAQNPNGKDIYIYSNKFKLIKSWYGIFLKGAINGSNTIANNIINVEDLTQGFPIAASNCLSDLNIWSNDITIDGNALHVMEIVGPGNLHIEYNNIHIDDINITNPVLFHGIHIWGGITQSGYNRELDHNIFINNTNKYSENFRAYLINGKPEISLYCNTSQDAPVGFNFQGMNGNASFIGNEVITTSSYSDGLVFGLLIDKLSHIGNQPPLSTQNYYGNKFNFSHSIQTEAENNGDVTLSVFRVNPTLPTTVPTPVYPDMQQWFKYGSNPTLLNCQPVLSESNAPHILPFHYYTDFDSLIAESYFENLDLSTNQHRELWTNLLIKSISIGNLNQPSIIKNFINSIKTNDLNIYTYAQRKASVNLYTSNVSFNSANIRTKLAQSILNLKQIQLLKHDENKRNSHLNNIKSIHKSLKVINNNNEIIKSHLVDSINSWINKTNSNNLPELYYYQMLKELFNPNDFNPNTPQSNYQHILNIANLCPNDYVDAVSIARGVLNQVKSPYSYDDNCNSKEKSRLPKSHSKNLFTCYPNPVSNTLHLNTNNFELPIKNIKVYSPNRTIKHINNVYSDFSIDVSNLNKGVYCIIITDNKGIPHYAKFVK